MDWKIALAAALLTASASAHAQERTAGQANDAQINWSVLSNKIDAISTQNQALAASMATLQGQITNLQASVNGLNTKVEAIRKCGAKKQVWIGGDTCAVAGSTPPLPKLQTAGFTITRAYGGPVPALGGYCQSHGYDALASYTTTTSTRHVGGRTGGEETYTSGYHLTCMRLVN